MFQQLIAIGYLGKDPESRSLPNGQTVTNFSVATSEKWKDKQTGEQKERTEWFNCQAFGRTGEIAAEYLKKGSLVTIVGTLATRKWQDKEGNDRYTTEVRVNELKLMPQPEKRGDQGSRPAQAQTRAAAPAQRQAAPAADDGFDDDIPF